MREWQKEVNLRQKKRRKSNKYRPWFGFALWLVRLFTKKRKVEGELVNEPCMYLCRHRDEDGVIGAFTSLKTVLRPWALQTFLKYKKSIRHFRDYTLTEKAKMPKWIATVLAPFCGFGVTSLAKSARAIPVYRGADGAMKSIGTIKASVRALEEGDKLLVFPDVDYASEDDCGVGELYKGFILVDKLYFKRNAQHVKFVPVYISKDKVVIHSPLEFKEGQEETVYRKIVAGIYNESIDEMVEQSA